MKYELYLGDCLEVINEIPEESVDLVLCDLPYGTTQNKWDSVIPLQPMWEALRRVLKPGAAFITTASQPFTSVLVASNLNGFRHEWVWEKNLATGHLNANRRPMRGHEDVLVFCDRQPLYQPQMTEGHKPKKYTKRGSKSSSYGEYNSTEYGGSTSGSTKRYPRSVISFPVMNNDDPEKWHPTQKPVSLFEYLLLTYSREGDMVLDIAMGSGTTGVACMNHNRRFIGIEKDTEIFRRAEDRLKSASTGKENPLQRSIFDEVAA